MLVRSLIRIGMAMLVLFLCVSCTHRKTPIASTPPPTASDSYLDLEAGYRLRVITPITKSGRYQVETKAQAPTSAGDNRLNVTLRASDDFLGYETSYYSLTGSARQARIEFASAERSIEGKAAPAPQPLVRLFNAPRRLPYQRLVYLIRQSESDHDMAYLAARTPAALDQLTITVRAAGTACRSARNSYCSWIPSGVAVRAEALTNNTWQPVR